MRLDRVSKTSVPGRMHAVIPLQTSFCPHPFSSVYSGYCPTESCAGLFFVCFKSGSVGWDGEGDFP